MPAMRRWHQVNLGTTLAIMITASILVNHSFEFFSTFNVGGEEIRHARYGWPFQLVETSTNKGAWYSTDFSATNSTNRPTWAWAGIVVCEVFAWLGILAAVAAVFEIVVRRWNVHPATLMLAYVLAGLAIWQQFKFYKLVGQGADPLNPPTAWGWPLPIYRMEWIEVNSISQLAKTWSLANAAVNAAVIAIVVGIVAVALEKLLRRRSAPLQVAESRSA